MSVLVTVQLTSTTDSKSNEIITASHHYDPKYIHTEGMTGKNNKPSPFINHAGLELMLIEELVGRLFPYMPAMLMTDLVVHINFNVLTFKL